MPTYEYRCNQCGQRTSFWVRAYEPPAEPICTACGSRELARLFSPVAYHRSEADRLAAVNTSKPQAEDYYRDDRNIGLWAKKRMLELGHDPEPEFEAIVEKAKKETKEKLSS